MPRVDIRRWGQRNKQWFDGRLNELGEDYWLQPKKMVSRIRYDAVVRMLKNCLTSQGKPPSLNYKSFLDIGCGCGDFLEYMKAQGEFNASACKVYFVGTDVYSTAIQRAQQKLPSTPSIETEWLEKDVIGAVDPSEVKLQGGFDFVTAIAVFGYRPGSLSETEQLFMDCLDTAYRFCRKAAVVTAFSHFKSEMDVSDACFDPMWAYSIARRLSTRVVLDSSYLPHEFCLGLFKEDSLFMQEWKRCGGWNDNTRS